MSCSFPENIAFGLEEACNKIIQEKIFSAIQEYNSQLAEQIDEIKLNWQYNNYEIYIYGIEISEELISDFIMKYDFSGIVGSCKPFWSQRTERRKYTGFCIPYDQIHFYRVKTEAESFIILVQASLQEFLDQMQIHQSVDFRAPINEKKIYVEFDDSHSGKMHFLNRSR